MMLIDDRKKLILKAIIDSYIDTAEPVGSRTIARKHGIWLSSATIRNEMSDLEEMGFLEQPHTSSGRIPSNKGYRFYVDQLMPKTELTPQEIKQIKGALKMRINELSQLVSQVSAVVSDITKYTSMAMTPQMNKSVLKSVQVLPVNHDKLIVVVVTNAGVIKNSLARTQGTLTPDSLQRLSSMLSVSLEGVMLDKINIEDLIDKMKIETDVDIETASCVADGISDCLCQIFASDVYLEGTSNIFNFPEFHSVPKAKQFLDILNTKEILCTMMRKGIENGGIKVRIGTENEIEEIKDYSVVTTTYIVNDQIMGSIGVIGPTRMEYAKVIASLNYIRKAISREIMQIMGIRPISI